MTRYIANTTSGPSNLTTTLLFHDGNRRTLSHEQTMIFSYHLFDHSPTKQLFSRWLPSFFHWPFMVSYFLLFFLCMGLRGSNKIPSSSFTTFLFLSIIIQIVPFCSFDAFEHILPLVLRSSIVTRKVVALFISQAFCMGGDLFSFSSKFPFNFLCHLIIARINFCFPYMYALLLSH